MTWHLGDLVLAFTLGLCAISAASLGVLLWRELEAWYWRYRLVKAVEQIRKPFVRSGRTDTGTVAPFVASSKGQ